MCQESNGRNHAQQSVSLIFSKQCDLSWQFFAQIKQCQSSKSSYYRGMRHLINSAIYATARADPGHCWSSYSIDNYTQSEFQSWQNICKQLNSMSYILGRQNCFWEARISDWWSQEASLIDSHHHAKDSIYSLLLLCLTNFLPLRDPSLEA